MASKKNIKRQVVPLLHKLLIFNFKKWQKSVSAVPSNQPSNPSQTRVNGHACSQHMLRWRPQSLLQTDVLYDDDSTTHASMNNGDVRLSDQLSHLVAASKN